jgi:Cft2 family RNA processing exonuclease
LDAVIITHAHADHIGAIPLVVGSMPEVPIYTTPATMSLMSVMFRDALQIMESRLEADGELPSYDLLQVQTVEAAFRPVDIKQEFTINGAVNVTFYRAGHIPGAVSVFLQADNGSILVSGDVSFSPMRATPIAEVPPVRPDALILETTYGGKLHAARRAEEERLIDAVKQIVENGGRVLIPAFALGRAQEVALVLDNAIFKKKLDPVNIYLDGMTRSITKVFERFPNYLSKELQWQLENYMSLFRSNSVQFVEHRMQREELAVSNEPAVIIASSGMMTGGASPMYAQHMVKNPRNAIFITGYQDEESPGRMLQNLAAAGGGTITLMRKKIEVKCVVGTYSLSAHADENELTQFAIQVEPRRVFLVHGDPSARDRMRDLLRQRRMGVTLPRLGEAIEFEGSPVLGRRRDILGIPNVAITPITTLEEIDSNLPLHDTDGHLYPQNAKKAIEQILPPETGLRKVSFEMDTRTIRLNFDFPLVAAQQYAEQIETIRQMVSGWGLELNTQVNQVTLNDVARELIPDMIGRPSLHLADNVIEVKLKATPANWAEIQQAFRERTGFQVIIKGEEPRPAPQGGNGSAFKVSRPSTSQREINEAYGILRNALTPYGLYKTGLKNGVIVLSFITPEQGYRQSALIEELAMQVGYPLDIHPHPNQIVLIERVVELCREREIYLVKNPSILIAEKAIQIEPADRLSTAQEDELQAAFKAEMGWELRFKR